jgi:Domain of unknown function (DUF4365)
MNRFSPTERVGVNATEATVIKDLGWIFREQAISDMGIDAHIESVLEGKPTGQLIGVQIKTGVSHFKDKEDHLVYYGDLVHLDYWLQHSLPIILVAHLPDSQTTLWVQVNKSLVQRTGKGWKIEIPKSQTLEKSSAPALLAVLDGTLQEVKSRNLTLQIDYMKFIEKGGKLVIYKEEWHNKSLGRGALNLLKINKDGSEEIIKADNFWYTGYDVKGLVQAVYPWAAVSLDEDFYEANFDESFYHVYSDAYIAKNEIYPYATLLGEISLYRVKIHLNSLGKSFLEVMSYLDAKA